MSKSPRFTDEQIARFWSKTEKKASGCWEWRGRKRQQDGYALAKLGPYETTAHRIAYYIKTGVRPAPQMHIMHSCDNRTCCNPAHLSVGTPKENAQDSVMKGRRCGRSRTTPPGLSSKPTAGL